MHTSRVFTKFDCERICSISADYSVKDPGEKENVHLLLEQISRTRPVDQRKIKSNIVTINSKFILRNLGTGIKEEFYLVLPEEADPKKNRISVFSGLGSQILGSKIGTVVKGSHGANQYFSIEEITYQPEASGDYHL